MFFGKIYARVIFLCSKTQPDNKWYGVNEFIVHPMWQYSWDNAESCWWLKVCLRLVTGCWFFRGTSVSSTNKTEHQDTTKILLQVALNTITLKVVINLTTIRSWPRWPPGSQRGTFLVQKSLPNNHQHYVIKFISHMSCGRSVVFYRFSGFLHQ
jgi:hypothetical protein